MEVAVNFRMVQLSVGRRVMSLLLTIPMAAVISGLVYIIVKVSLNL